MPEILSFTEYHLIDRMMSLTTAAMLGTFMFMLLAQQRVSSRYKMALSISVVIATIAGWHYLELRHSFHNSYSFVNDIYVATSLPFLNGYRYADWILTVPALVVQLVLVLNLPSRQTTSISIKLVLGTIFMIALGYPGEISEHLFNRLLWGAMSTVPFSYVLYVLWIELHDATQNQSAEVRILFRNIRLLLLATWGFYPIVYLSPLIDIIFPGVFESAILFTSVQVGYGVADMVAKNGYGFMIYAIARAQMRAENETPEDTIYAENKTPEDIIYAENETTEDIIHAGTPPSQNGEAVLSPQHIEHKEGWFRIVDYKEGWFKITSTN